MTDHSMSEQCSLLNSLEWKRLSTLCQNIDFLPNGEHVNLVAMPVQEPHHVGDRVFCRAKVSDGEGRTRLVLLVLRSADWQLYRFSEAPLKILQATVQYTDHVPLLDCTGITTAVVTTAVVHDDTCLQVAEVFCGGFSGWAQACYAFRRYQVPVHMRWTIDVDPQCTAMLRCRDEKFQEISSLEELDQLEDAHQATFHICADVQWGWWLRVLGRFPVKVLCVSAPCQPWSRAGTGSGLMGLCSQEGGLLLRVADFSAACEILIVLLEQIEFFPRHQHYPQVMQAWQDCGYKILWQQNLNLRDVLPGQRMRHLLVLGRPDLVSAADIDQGFWAMVKRQSLALVDVIFPLPPPLLEECTLAPDVLDMYMDPWLVPTPARPGARPPTPSNYRVKRHEDCAGVFMAQYQFQHELPPGMLERQGLHRCLLRGPSGLRFFAGVEVAAVHGAVQPILLLKDRPDQMRLLGNAIAVPHAAAALAQACRLAHCPNAPDMMLAVQWCLASRMHCSNTALLPLQAGWVWCKQEQIPDVIAALQAGEPSDLQVEAPPAFAKVLLRSDNASTFAVAAPTGLPCATLLDAVGAVSAAAAAGALPWLPTADPTSFRVSSAPQLNMSGFIGGSGLKSGLCTVLTRQEVYLVDHSGPRTWSQLLRVFQDLDPANDPDCCLGVYSLSSQRLTDHKPFGSCVVAVSEDEDVPAFSLLSLAPHVTEVSVCQQETAIVFRGPAFAASDLWMGFPFQVLSPLGWQSDIHGLPPRDHAPVEFRLTPEEGRPAMPADLMLNQCRVWLFVSQVEQALHDCAAEILVDVEIQLIACRLWVGKLPREVALQTISEWWQRASTACALPGNHRVFSGPHPQDAMVTVGDASLTKANVIRKTGHLLVTRQPELGGGGVKDENLQLAKTKVATLLPDRGVSPPETLVTDNRTEKAAKRWQRAIRRRKLNGPTTVKACDFQLEEGSWVGIDGAAVSILQTATHNSEGVLLLDAPEATPVDLDLLRNIESDALCVVVPGHACPDPESCSGVVSVPARHKISGQVHLLAACYHNVGATDIVPFVQHGTDITVTGTTCCAFVMHKSDFPPAEWLEVVRAPVRTAAEAFRKAGVQQAFKDPWSRQYRCEGRPSQPQLSDSCTFNAKVTTALLRPLLQQSGFNNIYLVPKTWDRQLLPGWSVVWLAGDKAESEKQAALVAEQHGLVRTQARFGIRVPEAAFDKVFRQLRPGVEPPASVSVKQLFLAGPFPAGTTADDVVAWAAKLGWPAKAVKSLGPMFWLLGAANKPPAQTTRFNSTPGADQ